MGHPKPSRETKFLGANENIKILTFPVKVAVNTV